MREMGKGEQRLDECEIHATLDSILSVGDKARVRFTIFNAKTAPEDVIVKLRNKLIPVELPLPFSVKREEGAYRITSSFTPKDYPFQEIYWEVFAAFNLHGTRLLVPVKIGKNQRRMLYFRNSQWKLDGNKVLFTHISKEGWLSFVYRDYYPKIDTYSFRVKELAAVAVFMVLRPYWNRKRLWLVFEKFCKSAQDNGYHFFEYCMSLPPQESKHIYYVIDKSQPDYEHVKAHDNHVIQFLSFKHLLYCLAANIYVGSDSKMHLYVWRSKPSLVRHMISRHKLFFLQHGVTALKRVDNLFGKDGSAPVTYFLTTSKREQEIVVDHFGYQSTHAPVLGFSRWDVLENRIDESSRTILLMPTWRPWLEEQSDSVFMDSDYFRNYSELIQSEELIDMLERHNLKMRFFIHPKLSERLHNFHSSSDRIVLVPQGSRPLNELLMECSMLITDYSSVCWDALYMRKPVAFFQFDLNAYEEKVGSYINLSSDLPGDSCATIDELITSIDDCASRNFVLAPGYDEAANSWFENRDQSNRKRTYDFIISQGF